MTIHRFFVPDQSFQSNRVTLPTDLSKQIHDVLRLKREEQIILLDNSGVEYLVEIDGLSKTGVTGIIIRKSENNNEPTINLTLFQSLVPREKFESILQKGTEVGIKTFIPLITERSLLKDKEIKSERIERWSRIIREAAEQSERGFLPILEPVQTFNDMITNLNKYDLVLLAWERNEEQNFNQVLNDFSDAKNIALIIGPEGGFSQKEIEQVAEKGVRLVSLGKRILRTETAGIVMAGIVLYQLD